MLFNSFANFNLLESREIVLFSLFIKGRDGDLNFFLMEYMFWIDAAYFNIWIPG
jgi:hypothetical protein